MLRLRGQSRYRKDAKKYRHDKKATAAVAEVVELLLTGQPLPPHYREHTLIGNYAGCWECHCLGDVLLVYERTDAELILHRLGSHAELFR